MFPQLVIVCLVQYVGYPALSARIVLEQLRVVLSYALKRRFLHSAALLTATNSIVQTDALPVVATVANV